MNLGCYYVEGVLHKLQSLRDPNILLANMDYRCIQPVNAKCIRVTKHNDFLLPETQHVSQLFETATTPADHIEVGRKCFLSEYFFYS